MFTAWWSRQSGVPAPDDTLLSEPLAVMGAPVHLAGDHQFRVAWTSPTGAHRVGCAADRAHGTQVVAWARLDNLADIRAALGSDRSPSADAHVAEWLLAAYLAWGSDAPQRLVGDISAVVHDPQRHLLLAWRDAIGVRPLAYAQDGDAFAVSTSMAALTRLPGVDSRINQAWIVHHGLGLTMHQETSAYVGVHRVSSGSSVSVTPHAVTSNAFARFDPDSPWRERLDEEWVRQMRHVLDEAVAARLPADGPVAAEMTAGLDSSSISGTLAGRLGAADRLHLYGIPTYSDPEELITATAKLNGISRINVRPAWLDGEAETAGPRIDTALGYLHSHGMVTSMVPTYRLAAGEGAVTLFSGHGGDECVSMYAQRALLEWLDRGDWRGAATQVVTPGWKAPLRVIRRARQLAANSGDAPDEVRAIWLQTGIRREALEAAGVPELLARQEQAWNTRRLNNEVVDDNGRLRPDVRDYWSRRAEECSVASAMYGVEYVWPLLDTRLIQQFLSTPTVEKFHAGYSRYLFRRVIAPVVPAEVTWRPSKAPGWSAPTALADNREGLPLNAKQVHPSLAVVLDPDVLACGEVAPRGSLGRLSRWRLRDVAHWLAEHQGDTGAGASAP